MSESTFKKNRKRAVATTLLAGLCSLGIVGGTLASLNTSITDGPDTHRIYSEEVRPFGFAYTVDSGVIDADISMNAGVTLATLKVENTGSIPAHFAFYVDPASIEGLDLDNPIFTESRVNLVVNGKWLGSSIPTGHASESGGVITLKEFLTTAFVTDIVLDPQGTFAKVTDQTPSEYNRDEIEFMITILAPDETTWSSPKGAAAIDQLFGTKVTFNQLNSDNTSNLVTYAAANGIEVLDDTSEEVKTYKLPVALLADATL